MANVLLTGFADVDKQLAQLPIEIRGKTLKDAMKKAAQVIVSRARDLVPPPGYPGDKPELKPLRDSIVAKGSSARDTTSGLVKAAGQHSHLVEGAYFKDGVWINVDVRHTSYGSPTGTILKKHPFIQPAEEQTKSQQLAAIREGVSLAVKKATGQ